MRARKKNFFFVKFIELIRSISNPFEFCKSDEDWAQLLALKLRQMLKLFATQQILMFLMFSLAYLFFFSLRANENIKNIKLRIASTSVLTSKRVTQLSFHLICKIQTNLKCYESGQ
jgi:hypothetical protein